MAEIPKDKDLTLIEINQLIYAAATVITEEINAKYDTNQKLRVQKYPIGLDTNRIV